MENLWRATVFETEVILIFETERIHSRHAVGFSRSFFFLVRWSIIKKVISLLLGLGAMLIITLPLSYIVLSTSQTLF